MTTWRPTVMVLTGAIVCAAACKEEKKPEVATRPPEVYVADVVQKDVPDYIDLVGQTDGSQDVEIRARVEGFLETMNFREGSFVRQGDVLYQIDRKPLEAALAGAMADKATADARLTKTNNDVARYTPLVAKQAVSQKELDDARSGQEAARTQVEAAKAAVEKAKLDLGYTRVLSPINGLAGTTRVKPGNLVGRGEPTLLTTVSQIDPILFKVGVSEADFLRIVKRYPERVGKAPSADDIELLLADGTVHRYKGSVSAVERAVNPTTGTIGVQIEFPNKGYVLRPGQYGRVRLLMGVKRGALLVPQRAVQELQNIYSVAVVDRQNTVAFRNVKVGDKVGSMWMIEDGLSPGDRVVAEGLQRVRDGLVVDPKPASQDDTKPGAEPVALIK